MKYVIIIGITMTVLFLLLRYFSIKRNKSDKSALEKAFAAKDYDKYLTIINYKISQTKDLKDKNILATLKVHAYLPLGNWEKMDALYKQVDKKKLPKAIKLTFLCHYITGLFLSERPDAANAFLEKNKTFLKEGEGNSKYQLYLDGFKGFGAYYQGKDEIAKTIFTKLKDDKIGNEFYRSTYQKYLDAIDARKEQ